jgi:hypothetical protein
MDELKQQYQDERNEMTKRLDKKNLYEEYIAQKREVRENKK